MTCGRIVGLCLLASFLLLGCSSKALKSPSSAEDYYRLAEEDLRRGNCLDAMEKFRKLVISFPGSALADDAQFGLAESYFCSEDYVNAIFEYERVSEYRGSPWIDDAQFKIALCYFHQSLPAQLDQANTYRAILEFKRFLEDYPDSPLVEEARAKILQLRNRLAEKAYRTARNYAKWDDWEAALIYYNSVVEEYSDTKWVPSALFGIGEVLLKQKKTEEALGYFRRVAEGGADEKLRRKAKGRIEEIGKMLKR